MEIQSIDHRLERPDTNPSTQAKILKTLSIIQLRSWSTLTSTPLNKRAAAAQETIGLTHTLIGEWYIQWTCLKEQHYQRKGSNCSIYKWLYNLIRVTVTEAHGLWIDHNEKLRESRGVDIMELTAINNMVADQHQQGLHGLLTHCFPISNKISTNYCTKLPK